VDDIVTPDKVLHFLEDVIFKLKKRTRISTDTGYDGVIGLTDHNPTITKEMNQAKDEEFEIRGKFHKGKISSINIYNA